MKNKCEELYCNKEAKVWIVRKCCLVHAQGKKILDEESLDIIDKEIMREDF